MDNKHYTELDAPQCTQRAFSEPTDAFNVNSQLQTMYKVGTTQTVAALSTLDKIYTTGTIPNYGDIIKFVTGPYAGLERSVKDLSSSGANYFYLTEALPSNPIGYTFDVLRKVYATSDAAGNLLVTATTIAGAISYNLNGSVVEVTEDTVVPANNHALPVKITGLTGDVNITAGDLNVDISAYGAHPSSVRISDGITEASVSTNGHLKVADLLSSLTVKQFAYNDCSSVSITTSSYVELIAATSASTNKIQVLDTTGAWTLIATGAISSEVPLFIAGPGSVETVQAVVPAGTRLSVKALDANATSGSYAINLLG